ncbi:uncharacterized protein LTR77_006894 [Saxophila tyrrhenica]|uniref:Zn(2)-C6 fungal-type domain-containing protein n=1 Tax=Saxophila tyrrhenica TaxID=1690608 RepID=A0AAV9P928_9PEZI|nr:hypothetical protein LTR77_006894 [Saxophila tyrrhenica]
MEIDSQPLQPQTQLQSVSGSVAKRRAACDECRTKKLKCTGEQPKCSRCAREGITCIYSIQKQMGRPKKRQRTDDDEHHDAHPHEEHVIPNKDQQPQAWDFPPPDEPYNVLTPGGSVQPWLLDFDTDPTLYPSDSALPALTPDNNSTSSHSPPVLNLPPELQQTHHHNHNHIDPSLPQPDSTNLGLPASLLPPCACLSTMYLTLSNLSSMPPSFPFPFALHPLRSAMQTAADVLACEHCPQRFISAIQNTQLIGTLLMSLAERYGKVLSAISSEAERAEREGEKKKFRLADLNTANGHLHTNGIGCAAAFNLELEADEWRSLAKKVVRAEVCGADDGGEMNPLSESNEMNGTGGGDPHSHCPSFLGIISKMERRQEFWHNKPMPEDFPKDHVTGLPIGGKHLPKEDHLCLKYVGYARRMVEGYDWS